MTFTKYVAAAAVLSAVVLKVGVGIGGEKKDTTAQGLAKIRHCESILDDPMYVDPYAHLMYPGSSVQTLLGGRATLAVADWFLDGIFDHLSLRTKWIDDAVLGRANDNNNSYYDQLVILGAGYDTRGFRLDLPDGFAVWEVDQPGVQSRKRRLMEGIAATDRAVGARLGKPSPSAPHVEFLEIDFNADSIGERLVSQPAFDRTKPTIVTLEGVTQYIPNSATAGTLRQVRGFLSGGSVLVVSYVPSEVLDDTGSACPASAWRLRLLLRFFAWIGEPWIGSYPTAGFESFLRDSGYEIIENVGFSELNRRYLVPRNRGRKDEELCNTERYVIARAV